MDEPVLPLPLDVCDMEGMREDEPMLPFPVDLKEDAGRIAACYQIQGNIGKGAFGIIHKAIRRADGESVVIKEINLDALNEDERQAAVREGSTLSRFHHNNIIRYHETYRYGGVILLCVSDRSSNLPTD
jgi:serine/threonine protein kinase